MASNPLLSHLLLVALVLTCLLSHVGFPDAPRRVPTTPRESNQRRRRRAKALKPFTGLIHTAAL